MKTKHSRGQFTFYASYFDAVDRQPKSRRMEAFYAIARYALDGVEPEGLSASVNSMFEGLRPNIDSGRTKAEKMQNAKCRSRDDGDETEEKTKTKTKIKSKSEEERKTETEKKTEGAPVGAAIGRPQEANAMESTVGAGVPDGPRSEPAGVDPSAPSLSERKENDTVFGGTTPPEQREPYAEMFRADPILASAWKDLLAEGPELRPLGIGEREKLLERLRAAPAWERLAILNDRMGCTLSRDLQTLQRRLRAQSCPGTGDAVFRGLTAS